MKYGLHGKLEATEGNSNALANILIEASKLVSKAPGCNLYYVSKDTGLPNTIWITEVWDSKEHHDNSLKDQAVKSLISKAIPLLAGNPTKGQELSVIGGFGV